MKKSLLALLGLLFAASASAQVRNATDFITPLGYCQLTSVASSTLVSSCAGGIPANPISSIAQVEGSVVSQFENNCP